MNDIDEKDFDEGLTGQVVRGEINSDHISESSSEKKY